MAEAPAAASDDEAARLRLLHELRILDTPPEPGFDAIARLATELTDCSIGVLCFVDAERLWLKASVGIDLHEIPRQAGFCAQAIREREPVLVDDATIDPRFASIAGLAQPPGVRNYAAAQVRVDGHAVATVAVFDPRQRALGGGVRRALVDLAQLASDLLQARLAAQRARLQEARVRTASRASSDWLWETDADDRVTWMSDSAAAHLGAPLASLVGQRWTELHAPRAGDSRQRYEAARARREAFGDLVAERPLDGGLLLVGFSGVPVFDAAGHFRGYRGAAHDATAEMSLREAAQRDARELALSEQRWKYALEVSSQGVWDWDLAAQRLYVSPGWRSMLGLTDDERVDSTLDWAARIHPDDLPGAQARLSAHLRGNTESCVGEFRMRHRDGRWLWVLNRGKVVQRSDSGHALRAVGTLVDVTERRAAELALRDKQAAELASQAKSRFLSRMSHEVRTPLNAMLGFTQLLLDSPDDAGAARVRSYAAHAVRAGRQLLELVDKVLDLQRVDDNGLPLRIEPVALAPLVARACDAVRDDAQARGVHLDPAVAPNFAARADAASLLHALVNLSSNAVRYNRPAGRVRWSVEPTDDRLSLIVEDTGAGMSDAQMTRLFEPFERLGRETGPIQGSGLGLIIARRLIEKMGGRLHINSRSGEGTRATIELPRAADVVAAAATSARAEPLRLLYVEDNRVNALLFAEAVKVVGQVELRIAEDGAEAVELVADWRPDLLVLDAHLPGMTGYEVLERLRALPGLERTPAVMCSADATPDDLARARAAGFVGYWTKPIDVGRVIADLQQFTAAAAAS